MFEVGAEYEFRVIKDGDQITFTGTVEKYEHPLIRLQDTPAIKSEMTEDDGAYRITFQPDPHGKTYPGSIINVESPAFVSAVRIDTSN